MIINQVLLACCFVLIAVFLPGPALADDPDPCAKIAARPFVLPLDALACYRSFPFNETLRQNILTNVARVMDFYTFEPFYNNSPPPFQESTVNIRAELARINTTTYQTDYDFNIDLFRFTLQLNDGHTRWVPSCYIAYQSIVPAPFVSLEIGGNQNVYIAPDSVEFISLIGPDYTAFYDSINFDWRRLAGAKVISIEGLPAYDYADLIARTVSGNFLDHGIRVNSVFTSYRIAANAATNRTGFSQRVGDMAGPNFVDKNDLTVQLVPVNSTVAENVTIPFFASYIGTDPFVDRKSYWDANCAAQKDTNGVDLKTEPGPQSQALVSREFPRRRNHRAMASIIDLSVIIAIDLPTEFQPSLPALGGSKGVIRSFLLPDNKTGVLFVGSFTGNFTGFQFDVATAITQLQSLGATHLLIDLHNNGGGFVCLGLFLHQYLAGSDFPTIAFQSTSRASPLAQKILKSAIELGLDTNISTYTADNWLFVNGTAIDKSFNYYDPTAPFSVNGISDPTSQRFTDSCSSAYVVPMPKTPPFPLRNVAMVGNGFCASTCAIFSTIMHELHNTVIAVFGGRPGQDIEYKGMAGNQVLEWAAIDTEIKTANLKDDPLAPPDLLVSGNFRHNWRAAWSFLDESTPIAYRSEGPDVRLPYTPETYNNPLNLWQLARQVVFDDQY